MLPLFWWQHFMHMLMHATTSTKTSELASFEQPRWMFWPDATQPTTKQMREITQIDTINY
jgi:hypothetical protein